MSELRLNGVTAGYPGRIVLRAINLTLHTGQLVALIGPNGVGKTTLLRCLAGQLQPQQGVITWEGIPLQERSPRWIARRIAMTRTGRVADRPVTVWESVALGRAPHRGWLLPLRESDREAVRAALERMGLAQHHDRLITQLSAGEWQRVCLARALAQEPQVLLVDEPTSHLDLRFQAEILDRLHELAREGMVVVAALHDLNLAALWADQIALLSKGTLQAWGRPEQILTTEQLTLAYETRLSVMLHPTLETPFVLPIPSRIGKNT